MRRPRWLVLLTLAILTLQVAPRQAFVASVVGQTYYWTGGSCRTWRQLKPENLLWFGTAREAEAAGYRPSRTRECVAPAQR